MSELNLYNQIKRKIKRYLRSYSRIILVLKTWMFSLAALFLGFFFIYPQLAEQQKLFDVSISSDVISDAQSVKITNIRLYSVDEKRTPYIITSKEAEETPPGSSIITMVSPMADIVTENEEAINITSVTGKIDEKKSLITLLDNVEVFSSEGYNIKSKELIFDMTTNVISSTTPVNASGDFGEIVSEGIEIFNKGDKVKFKGKTTIKLFER